MRRTMKLFDSEVGWKMLVIGNKPAFVYIICVFFNVSVCYVFMCVYAINGLKVLIHCNYFSTPTDDQRKDHFLPRDETTETLDLTLKYFVNVSTSIFTSQHPLYKQW